MNISKQTEFYKREIEEIEWSWDETFNSQALILFNRGELFKPRFEKYDEKRGSLLFSFPKVLEHLPRVNEEFSCFVVRSAFQDLNTCNGAKYFDLLDGLGENDISEIRLVSYFEGPDPLRIGAIFTEADTGFINRLKSKMVFFLGPKEPPLEYLGNLKSFSERFSLRPNESINPLLENIAEKIVNRLPVRLYEAQDISTYLLKSLEENDIVTLQGPPGVGKTYLAAQLLSKLMDNGSSILLTALTNKAVTEVCKKEAIQPYLKSGKVFKASLKSNEAKTYAGLLPTDKVHPIKGSVVLATYYTYSRIWSEATAPIFDFVIIEEASQSFLTTIISAKLIGKKIIIIGDPYQIQPIVTQKKPEQVDKNVGELIFGLDAFSRFSAFPYFRKVQSRRLCKRAVEYTNTFYQNQLESLVGLPDIQGFRKQFKELGEFIHPEGGPVLITMDLPYSKVVSKAREFVISVLKAGPHKKFTIAILAPFRETVGEMQGKVMNALNNYNIIVDTVDRVQGLDVDICFYIIPKASQDRGLDFNRFNVATSRSKIATIIIADKSIKTTNNGDPLPIQYIRRLSDDHHFYI